MGVQRYRLSSGVVRYRARVKSHGREVATRVFERRAEAVAWEQDQRRRLRLGEWIDPRRGQVPLSVVAADWLGSRGSVKRRTQETDEAAWRNFVQPRFGNWPVASITAAEVSSWVGSLVARGLAPSTATRALATLRSILAFAVADGRVQHNVAAAARNPTSGRARREGQALTVGDGLLADGGVPGPLPRRVAGGMLECPSCKFRVPPEDFSAHQMSAHKPGRSRPRIAQGGLVSPR